MLILIKSNDIFLLINLSVLLIFTVSKKNCYKKCFLFMPKKIKTRPEPAWSLNE